MSIKLPKQLEPGRDYKNELDQWASQVATLRKQQILLLMLEWIEENRTQLRGVHFKISINNGQIFHDEDEFVRAHGMSEDQEETAKERVDQLAEDLDYNQTPDIESFLAKTVSLMGDSCTLQKLDDVINHRCRSLGVENPEKWLAEHRAHFQQENLQEKTPNSSPSPPRPRI